MPGTTYDIVTVGGGLGGSALAKAMAERGARVEVGSARLMESGSNFREAGDDHGHADAGQNNGQRADSSEQAGDRGGQSEDAAADDRVHHQRGEAPAAEGADEFLSRRGLWEGIRHRVFLSHMRDRLVPNVST